MAELVLAKGRFTRSDIVQAQKDGQGVRTRHYDLLQAHLEQAAPSHAMPSRSFKDRVRSAKSRFDGFLKKPKTPASPAARPTPAAADVKPAGPTLGPHAEDSDFVDGVLRPLVLALAHPEEALDPAAESQLAETLKDAIEAGDAREVVAWRPGQGRLDLAEPRADGLSLLDRAMRSPDPDVTSAATLMHCGSIPARAPSERYLQVCRAAGASGNLEFVEELLQIRHTDQVQLALAKAASRAGHAELTARILQA